MYVKAPPSRLRQAHARLYIAPSTGLSGLGRFRESCCYDCATNTQLAGFGSSLRKAVKSIGSSIKKAVPKVAKLAAPVAGFLIAGPAGAAVGGALARGVQPGGFNIKLAARGAITAGAIGVGVSAAAPFVQSGFAKLGAGFAAQAPVGVGSGALSTVSGAAAATQAATVAQPSVWSSIFGTVTAAAKPVAVSFARDLLTSKIMGSQAEEVAAAEQNYGNPTYYPYPVYDQAGNIVGTGAVPAGGGGFLEPGQTVGDETLAFDEASKPSLVPGLVLLGVLGFLALR